MFSSCDDVCRTHWYKTGMYRSYIFIANWENMTSGTKFWTISLSWAVHRIANNQFSMPLFLRSVLLTPLKMIFTLSVQLDRAMCPKVWLHTFQASWFESVATRCILPKLAACQRVTDFIAPPSSKWDMETLFLFILLETGSQMLAQCFVFQV